MVTLSGGLGGAVRSASGPLKRPDSPSAGLGQFHLPGQGGVALVSVRFETHYGFKSDIALSRKVSTATLRRQLAMKEAASEAPLLLLESLCGQPEQMKRFAGFVAYFQAPFGIVAKACDGVADEVRAHLRTLVPCGVMIS